MINQKDIYVGLNQPSNNELLWARPQSNGSVILSVKVNNGWVAANSESGGGQYYSKQEIDNRFADILGIDAEGIAALKALVEDGSALTGLLGEINDKASLSKANTFTKKNTFSIDSSRYVEIGANLPHNTALRVVGYNNEVEISHNGNGITFRSGNYSTGIAQTGNDLVGKIDGIYYPLAYKKDIPTNQTPQHGSEETSLVTRDDKYKYKLLTDSFDVDTSSFNKAAEEFQLGVTFNSEVEISSALKLDGSVQSIEVASVMGSNMVIEYGVDNTITHTQGLKVANTLYIKVYKTFVGYCYINYSSSTGRQPYPTFYVKDSNNETIRSQQVYNSSNGGYFYLTTLEPGTYTITNDKNAEFEVVRFWGDCNNVQVATVAKTGSYNDLLNKPTNVSAFTNDAEYITASDISNYVQKSSTSGLLKNDGTVDTTRYTTNTGTITGITMNGTSKGTSGVVNLGTVITSHQDISGKENKASVATSLPSGTNKLVPNTIYKINTSQNSKTVYLPAPSTDNAGQSIVIRFIAGGTSGISFNGTVYYQKGGATQYESNNTYVASCVSDSGSWIVSINKLSSTQSLNSPS